MHQVCTKTIVKKQQFFQILAYCCKTLNKLFVSGSNIPELTSSAPQLKKEKEESHLKIKLTKRRQNIIPQNLCKIIVKKLVIFILLFPI